MKKYKLGAVLNKIDYRDIPVSAFQPISYTLPDKFITDISMLPVMNQLGLGSCVGHAVGLYLQLLDYKETGLITKVSPRYIYAMAKAIDQLSQQGTYPRAAAMQLSRHGALTEEAVFCDDTLTHKEYIDIAVVNGWLKIGGYAFVNPNANDIKQAIINNGAVVASLAVGDFSKAKVKPGTAGLHYIMIYGYDGDTFYFRNSWGEGWGDNGNGNFAFKDFEGQIFDIMVIADVPNTILDMYKGILYKKGSRGSGVAQLQRDLKELGYFTYPFITGYFGSVTEKAVKELQLFGNLTVDGKVGPKTLRMIDELKKKPNGVTITRISDNGVETLGELVAYKKGKEFRCKTIELAWKNNASNISCIPKGTYEVAMGLWSKKNKNYYLLKNVLNRFGIFIHAGNYHYNYQGCIGLGKDFADINKDGQTDITSTVATLKAFEKFMNKEPFTLTIQ